MSEASNERSITSYTARVTSCPSLTETRPLPQAVLTRTRRRGESLLAHLQVLDDIYWKNQHEDFQGQAVSDPDD